jgi:fluoroquinolone transport system permease protein
MNKFWRVYKAELYRLFRYKIIFFSFLVSAIWILILALSDAEVAEGLTPTLIVMDSGMMSILLLAASFYFEKQEETVKSMLVTPVPLALILLAKIASAMTAGIVSMLAVAGSAWILHGIETNLLLMAVYVLFIVAGNTAIGYFFILISKDFTGLIVKIAGVLMLFYVPSLLVPLGLLADEYAILALLSPVYAGNRLIQSLYESVPNQEIWISLLYLGLLAGILYPFVIYKKYQKVAIEG